jgi:bacillithiol biosynthesis deacetylase BshB1
MTKENKVDILAFGAHPDDVELGCGGTLLAHFAMGKTNAIVDLTEGELGTRGTVELRKNEAKNGAKILKSKERLNLSFKDGFFSNDEWHLREVIKMIRFFKPEIILCNAPFDRHPDHGKAAELIRDGSFLAGLSKIKTQWEGHTQDAHKTKSVYHYVQALDTHPDFVVDITPYFEQKMEAILAHQSQFFDPNSSEPKTFISSEEFLTFVRARAHDFGVPSGVKYAEGFTHNRTPGVNNLFNLF